MKHSHTLLSTLALTLTASFALAQDEVHFSGKVENGEGVCYYCPGFDFVVDNTHTSLSSSTIDLLPYVGSYCVGVGTWNGSTTSPAIEVLDISIVPQAFSIGGNSSPGGKMSFNVQAAPGEFALVAVAYKDGYVSLGDAGCAFLAPDTLFVLGQGFTGGSGQMSIKVDLPDDPNLVGRTVFAQAAVAHFDGTVTLTNSDRKVID
ncbi:MAG: hypothetical protein R3F34_05645 [Planctomycetota bacterium]